MVKNLRLHSCHLHLPDFTLFTNIYVLFNWYNYYRFIKIQAAIKSLANNHISAYVSPPSRQGLDDYRRWLDFFAKSQETIARHRPVVKRAYARVGLMGNPSDGFHGKTIALSISNFWAEVSLVESEKLVRNMSILMYRWWWCGGGTTLLASIILLSKVTCLTP